MQKLHIFAICATLKINLKNQYTKHSLMNEYILIRKSIFLVFCEKLDEDKGVTFVFKS